MAISNRERVGKALDLLCAGLAPFVERELKVVHGDKWEEIAREGQPPERGKPKKKTAKLHLDTQALLAVMWNQWNTVFNRTLGMAERSIVSELRDVRNKWAHQEAFSSSDAYRALDSMERLLTAVSAEQASEIGQMRMDLLRVQFDEQRRGEMRKASFTPTEGKPQGGLKPWREIVTPHPDVASGRYQQAEFAADLWQVYQNEGSDEYKHPTEFFRRTFITEGLRGLLQGALERIGRDRRRSRRRACRRTSAAARPTPNSRCGIRSRARPASEMPGVEELVKETGVRDCRRRQAGGAGRHEDFSGPTPQEAGWHRGPDALGRIGMAIGRQGGVQAGQGGRRNGNQSRRCPQGTFQQVRPVPDPHRRVGGLRPAVAGRHGPSGGHIRHSVHLRPDDQRMPPRPPSRRCWSSAFPSSDNEIGGRWGQEALARLKNAIGRVESLVAAGQSRRGV